MKVEMYDLIQKNKTALRKITRKYHKLKESEASVKDQIKGYAEITGWAIVPILQGLGCYPGITDFFLIKNGRVIFLETKSSSGSQRPAQIEFQKLIESHGGEYLLASCLEDFIEAVKYGK